MPDECRARSLGFSATLILLVVVPGAQLDVDPDADAGDAPAHSVGDAQTETSGSGQLEHACMQRSGMRRGAPKGGGPGREIRSSGREIGSSGREIGSSLRPFVQPAARVPPRLVGFVILGR